MVEGEKESTVGRVVGGTLGEGGGGGRAGWSRARGRTGATLGARWRDQRKRAARMLCPCARVAGGFVRGLVASCAASWERTGVALVVARARERAALGRERRERRDVAIARGQENLQSNRSAVKPRSNRSAVKPRAHRSAVKPRAGAGSRCSVRTRRGMHLGVVLLCRKRGPALLVAQRGHAGVRSVLGRGSRRLYRLRTKQRGVRGARGGKRASTWARARSRRRRGRGRGRGRRTALSPSAPLPARSGS